MRNSSVKKRVCKLYKVHYLKNNIGLSALLWKDRHTSNPYAFLKYNTEENHTTILLKIVALMHIHTPDRAICRCKVREEREEIVGRQGGDIYPCKRLDWARRSNSRAAPTTEDGSVHPLLAGWITFKGFLTPACLGHVKEISTVTQHYIVSKKEKRNT